MIFVDTSVLIAILASEPDRHEFELEFERAAVRLTSAAVRLETAMVLSAKLDIAPLAANGLFDRTLARADVKEVSIDGEIARIAVECFETFGKGRRHPARLNFGDCLSLACARFHKAKLVYKGRDFAEVGNVDFASAG